MAQRKTIDQHLCDIEKIEDQNERLLRVITLVPDGHMQNLEKYLLELLKIASYLVVLIAKGLSTCFNLLQTD
jgi:hypothetical protein